MNAFLKDFAKDHQFTIQADKTVVYRDRLTLAGHAFVAEVTYTDDENYTTRFLTVPEGFNGLDLRDRDVIMQGIERRLIRDLKGNLVSEALNR